MKELELLLDSCKMHIDISAPELVSSLKDLVGETTRWDFIPESTL